MSSIFFWAVFARASLLATQTEQVAAVSDAALAGLDGVLVVVKIGPKAVERLSLDKSQIDQRIEALLRKARVRNLGREQSVRQGAAQLLISIDVTSEAGSAAVAVEASIREPVLLVRDPKQSVVAVTWKAPLDLTVIRDDSTKARQQEQTLQSVEKQVKWLIQAFQRANPAEPGR